MCAVNVCEGSETAAAAERPILYIVVAGVGGGVVGMLEQ